MSDLSHRRPRIVLSIPLALGSSPSSPSSGTPPMCSTRHGTCTPASTRSSSGCSSSRCPGSGSGCSGAAPSACPPPPGWPPPCPSSSGVGSSAPCWSPEPTQPRPGQPQHLPPARSARARQPVLLRLHDGLQPSRFRAPDHRVAPAPASARPYADSSVSMQLIEVLRALSAADVSQIRSIPQPYKRQAGRPTECAIKRRGDMKKTPSMFIAAAGVTAGVLGLALPAAATTGTGHPRHRELPPRTRQRAGRPRPGPGPRWPGPGPRWPGPGPRWPGPGWPGPGWPGPG